LIIQLGGGKLAEGVADVWAKPFVAPRVKLRPARCNAILGLTVPVERQATILASLGLSPRVEGELIVCTIPPHRPDLTREIDLIEEVARLHGYDKVPLAHEVRHAVQSEPPARSMRREIGEILTACGYDEAVMPTFIDAAEEALFGQQRPVRVRETVRRSDNALRSSLLPSLLRACKTNQDAGNGDVSLFEVAAVFPPGEAGGLPEEFVQIGMATNDDLRDLQGAVEALVERLAQQAKLSLLEQPVAGLAQDVSAVLLLNDRPAGVIGCVDSKAMDYYGLEKPVNVATLRFDMLLELAGQTRRYQPLPKFPAVSRDLSLIVDEDVTWKQLQQAVATVEQPLLAGLNYVTTYRGAPVPAGRKSVTVTLTYRSDQGTLRSEQVDQQVEHVVEAMRRKFSADLRK